MSFEGQAVTWDQFPSLLADVPEPENTGLEFVVAVDGLSSEKLNDVKTQISILSRELGLKYLSCIYDNVSTHEKSCEEHFFTAPLEFSKDIYIRQNVIGEFKQKYYRSEKGWGMDKTEKHKEWATVYVNSINFQKSLFRREVSAKLKIGYISWPEAKYRFTVQLFDDKWKGLAQDSAEFETSGMILSGKTLLGSTELDFSFGRWVDISKATTFEITVVPMPEDEAGLEPSLTQLGEKNDVQIEGVKSSGRDERQVQPIIRAVKNKAALANGVTVELIGICEHPSEGKQWASIDLIPITFLAPAGRSVANAGKNSEKFYHTNSPMHPQIHRVRC